MHKPDFRISRARSFVEDNNVTIADFTEKTMEAHPQCATAQLREQLAEEVSRLDLVQLAHLVSQHNTADIMDFTPDWLQAKYLNDGESALLALGIASLTLAVFMVCKEDESSDDGTGIEVYLRVDKGRADNSVRGMKVG